MRARGGGGARSLLAALARGAPAALIACHAEPRLPACEAYRDEPGAWEVCVVGQVARVSDTATAADLCARAGPAESSCREAWVSQATRAAPRDRAALLSFCADSEDCALEVLEARPAADVLEQAALCGRAGRYREECERHALQRWLQAGPGDADVARVLAAWPGDADLLGTWLGVRVGCDHVGACPADGGAVAAACERTVFGYRADPTRCPAAVPTPPGAPPP